MKDTALTTEASAPSPASGIKAWLPAISAVVLAPVVTLVVSEWILIPRLQAKLGLSAESAVEKKSDAAHGAAKNGTAEGSSFDYKDVVVNLAGTMGTRYLKTSFVVTGKGVRNAFEGDKARLADVTLGLLSSITLAD